MNLEKLIEEAKGLPPAPQILPNLLRLLQNSDSNFKEITTLVNMDPSLTVEVLKLANTAYFGGGVHCDQIEEAVQRVGFKEVYKLVAMICSQGCVDNSAPIYDLKDGNLWEQSIASALIMEILDTHNPTTSYTIGLLHYIGKLIINQLKPESYPEVFKVIRDEGCSLDVAEIKVLGFSNAQMSGAILRKWNFAEEICMPIEFQYNPMQAPEDYLDTSCYLHITNFIIGNLGMNFGKDAWAMNMDTDAANHIKLTEKKLQELIVKAHTKIEEIQGLVNMTTA